MRNSLINQCFKGIALAISFFVLFACCHNTIYAQRVTTLSPCFTVTITSVAAGAGCNTGVCGHEGWTPVGCSDCFKVTIKSDKCAGLNPNTFTVTSSATNDCHSVCSPNGDFTNDTHDPGASCSWYNPRTLYYKNIAGIPDNSVASFIICRNGSNGSKAVYTISCGCSCNGVLCTDAVITVP